MKLFQFLVAALLLVSSTIILAEKPDPNLPNPPLATRDANVDGNDWIRVHEQGTAKVDVQGIADVNVTGGTIDANVAGGSLTVDNTNANPVPVVGTVTVDNFPGQQGVWVDGGGLSPVTKAYYNHFRLDPDGATTGRINFSVGPIQATFIYVSTWNADETTITFYSESLAPAGENVIMFIDDRSGAVEDHTFVLPYPMEIDGFNIVCENESHFCNVRITVVGF